MARRIRDEERGGKAQLHILGKLWFSWDSILRSAEHLLLRKTGGGGGK